MAAPKKAAKKKAKKKSNVRTDIELHYIKTASYRTYHVDGAFGGLTPRGNIYCDFFVERAPTPQSMVHKITRDGQLGDEKNRTGKDGLVRQIECGISLDIKAAINLKTWLDEKIEEYQKNILVIKDDKKS